MEKETEEYDKETEEETFKEEEKRMRQWRRRQRGMINRQKRRPICKRRSEWDSREGDRGRWRGRRRRKSVQRNWAGADLILRKGDTIYWRTTESSTPPPPPLATDWNLSTLFDVSTSPPVPPERERDYSPPHKVIWFICLECVVAVTPVSNGESLIGYWISNHMTPLCWPFAYVPLTKTTNNSIIVVATMACLII